MVRSMTCDAGSIAQAALHPLLLLVMPLSALTSPFAPSSPQGHATRLITVSSISAG